MPKDSQAKIITKKHLARQEREQLQTRYVVIATIAVAVLVVGLIIFGLVDDNILKPNQPVAKVNGENISASDFKSYMNYILARYAGGLDATMIGDYIVDDMIDNTLIRQEAWKRQISVGAEEISPARMDNQLGYFPNGTPVPTPTHEPQPTSTFSAVQLTLVTPAPTITPTVTIPTPTPPPTVTATSTPAPTPTPLTKEGIDQLYSNYIQQSSANGISEKELKKFVEDQLYREKVMVAVLPEIPWDQDQVWYRQILLPSEEAANTTRTRLLAGESFSALALELNVDTNNPEVSWTSKASLKINFDATYADAVFALQEEGEISAPIKTQNGWYVVQMLGHENRPLRNDYERFQVWLDLQREAATIEKFDWLKFAPTAVPSQ